MKKFLKFSSLALLALLTFACSSSGVLTRYYTLAADSKIQASKTYPHKVVVKKFTVDPAYNSSNIVYRESPYDFMSYNHDLWATAPDHQITNILTEDLKQSGLFEKVEQRASEMPDYEITGHLISIEEVDEGSNRYARVAVEVSFRDVKKDSTLWMQTFDEKEALAGNEVREIAKSASKLVNRYAEAVISGIENVLSRPSAPESEVQ